MVSFKTPLIWLMAIYKLQIDNDERKYDFSLNIVFLEISVLIYIDNISFKIEDFRKNNIQYTNL